MSCIEASFHSTPVKLACEAAPSGGRCGNGFQGWAPCRARVQLMEAGQCLFPCFELVVFSPALFSPALFFDIIGIAVAHTL